MERTSSEAKATKDGAKEDADKCIGSSTRSDSSITDNSSSDETSNTGKGKGQGKDSSSSTDRSGSKKRDRSGLRKGKWTIEEEEYTSKVIQHFSCGLLTLPEGATLRSYLAEKLNCDPMRITKKYAGASCLGRRVHHFRDRPPPSFAEMQFAKVELDHLESRFKIRVRDGYSPPSLPPHSELLLSLSQQANPLLPLGVNTNATLPNWFGSGNTPAATMPALTPLNTSFTNHQQDLPNMLHAASLFKSTPTATPGPLQFAQTAPATATLQPAPTALSLHPTSGVLSPPAFQDPTLGHQPRVHQPSTTNVPAQPVVQNAMDLLKELSRSQQSVALSRFKSDGTLKTTDTPAFVPPLATRTTSQSATPAAAESPQHNIGKELIATFIKSTEFHNFVNTIINQCGSSVDVDTLSWAMGDAMTKLTPAIAHLVSTKITEKRQEDLRKLQQELEALQKNPQGQTLLSSIHLEQLLLNLLQQQHPVQPQQQQVQQQHVAPPQSQSQQNQQQQQQHQLQQQQLVHSLLHSKINASQSPNMSLLPAIIERSTSNPPTLHRNGRVPVPPQRPVSREPSKAKEPTVHGDPAQYFAQKLKEAYEQHTRAAFDRKENNENKQNANTEVKKGKEPATLKKSNTSSQRTDEEKAAGTILLGFLNALEHSYEDALREKPNVETSPSNVNTKSCDSSSDTYGNNSVNNEPAQVTDASSNPPESSNDELDSNSDKKTDPSSNDDSDKELMNKSLNRGPPRKRLKCKKLEDDRRSNSQ